MPLQDAARRRLGSTWRLLLKELSGFGVVGAVALVIDLTVFGLLYTTTGTGPVVAKLISTLLATTVAYLGHRHWSFSHRARTGARREYLLFLAVNAATLLLGLVVVAVVRYPLGQTSALVLQLANLGSIAVGTLIRFLAYRRWVFPATDSPVAARALARRTAAAAPAPASGSAPGPAPATP